MWWQHLFIWMNHIFDRLHTFYNIFSRTNSNRTTFTVFLNDKEIDAKFGWKSLWDCSAESNIFECFHFCSRVLSLVHPWTPNIYNQFFPLKKVSYKWAYIKNLDYNVFVLFFVLRWNFCTWFVFFICMPYHSNSF